MKLVHLTWRDAFHPENCKWYGQDDLDEFVMDCDFICENVGWVVHEDKDMITLASMVSGDNKSYSHIQRIPVGCVVKKKIIRNHR